MRRKGLSARLERHIERGEELMQLNRAAFDRNTQAFERMMEKLDRHERLFEQHERLFERHEQLFDKGKDDRDDLKVFIREMNMKAEKRFQDSSRRSDEFMADMSEKTKAILLELKESREESRAQREALLALIDRLPPPAQAA
jgi:hypothetical protein